MEKKLWFVVWTKEAAKAWGIPTKDLIISIEPAENIRFNLKPGKVGRPTYSFATVLAFFSSEIEAEAFRDGNPDWEVKSSTIVL